MVGIIPMLAAGVVDEELLDRAQAAGKHFADFLDRERTARPRAAARAGFAAWRAGTPADAARRRRHRPARAAVREAVRPRRVPLRLRAALAVGLPPGAPLRAGRARGPRARSTTSPPSRRPRMFGGNSNWRGPVWFPLNYLVIAALERYHRFFGDDYTVEYPTGSGRALPLDAVARDLWDRLISIFLVGRGRAAAVLRLGGPPAARPAVEGQHRLLRVLPRRQRRGARARPTRRAGPAWSPTSSGAATAR